jgi:acyl carrier protein
VFPDLPEREVATASVETLEGWDSVAAATLITTIEEEFGVEFDMDTVGSLTSYQAISDHLSGLLAD